MAVLPDAGGMTWEELQPLIAPLLASPSLAGVSLGCYNPDKDAPRRECGRALVDALGSAIRR